MQQLFEGVYLLEGEIGGRPLQLTYLKGKDAALLMDTGCAHDPSKFIASQISQAGSKVSELTWILNTHPDLDHIGGNHEMKQLAPHAMLACGDLDRIACQGFEQLMRHRYDVYRAEHGIFYEGATLDWLRAEAGEPAAIDVTFRGGEHMRLGPDWEVELLSVPGHAKGHLAIYDPAHQALYGGDAIHGAGYRGLDGKMKLCPTYVDVDDYLGTIRLIEHLPLNTYVGCHWPVKRHAEVAAFCRESVEFVDRADRLVLEHLATPQSLREICTVVGPRLGDWPRATDLELVFPLHGHLSRFVQTGQVIARPRKSEPHVMEYVRVQPKA